MLPVPAPKCFSASHTSVYMICRAYCLYPAIKRISAAISEAATPHMGIMFSIKKSVICTSLYQIENGGNSSAYQCSAYSRYDGGNDTAETLLRAVFYFGKSRIMDRELLIHKFHLRNHFGYIFILLMYFARDFFELFYSVRITFRACSYFGNEPFVYYDFSPLFCFIYRFCDTFFISWKPCREAFCLYSTMSKNACSQRHFCEAVNMAGCAKRRGGDAAKLAGASSLPILYHKFGGKSNICSVFFDFLYTMYLLRKGKILMQKCRFQCTGCLIDFALCHADTAGVPALPKRAQRLGSVSAQTSCPPATPLYAGVEPTHTRICSVLSWDMFARVV